MATFYHQDEHSGDNPSELSWYDSIRDATTDLQELTKGEVVLWYEIGIMLLRYGLVISPILAFGVIMGINDGWSILDSIYFATITMTTVGYGDFVPETQMERLFAIFFILFSVVVMAKILENISQVYINRQNDQAEANFLKKELTLADIDVMDTDEDGSVSMGEFLAFMVSASAVLSVFNVVVHSESSIHFNMH